MMNIEDLLIEFKDNLKLDYDLKKKKIGSTQEAKLNFIIKQII